MKRLTKHRKEILDIVAGSDTPQSAKMVISKMAEKPDLSTVYRGLEYLEEKKYINSVSFSDTRYYYSAAKKYKGHFIICSKQACICCGCIHKKNIRKAGTDKKQHCI